MEFDIDNNVDVIQYVLSIQTTNENGDITSEYVPALIESEFPKRRSRERQRNEHCWKQISRNKKRNLGKVYKTKKGKVIYPKVFCAEHNCYKNGNIPAECDSITSKERQDLFKSF